MWGIFRGFPVPLEGLAPLLWHLGSGFAWRRRRSKLLGPFAGGASCVGRPLSLSRFVGVPLCECEDPLVPAYIYSMQVQCWPSVEGFPNYSVPWLNISLEIPRAREILTRTLHSKTMKRRANLQHTPPRQSSPSFPLEDRSSSHSDK